MKKLFLLLIPFLFIGCYMDTSIFDVINTCDWDVEIEHDGNNFISKSNTQMEIEGNRYKEFELKSSKPVKLIRYDKTLEISNNYITSILNVKNNSNIDVSFSIKNNPDEETFDIIANSEKIFFIKTETLLIEKSTNNYYSMNKKNNEYYLIFY